MIGLHSFELDKTQILSRIEDFEQFCLGKRHMTPEEIRALNEEISIGALIVVGKYRFQKIENEVHLFWVSPDKYEHSLGPVNKLNVMRDCPGFHRTRSLALGHEYVETSSQMHVANTQSNISVVKMKDGSMGYGPNYKVALRNAALKMHIRNALESVNPFGFLKMFSPA